MMEEDFHHVSVLSDETLNGLAIKASGTYVDCTMGGAGHARLIADRLNEEGRLVGIDQDHESIVVGKKRLLGVRAKVDIVEASFSHLDDILQALAIKEVDGFLFDLGVSSHQIDTARRGFSYIKDAPLDMRMNQNSLLSAFDVVNGYDEEELVRIFKTYGEERFATRIARAILREREKHPLSTTLELANLIKSAIPAFALRKERGNPAKRVFQAIRIEVNGELRILENSLRTAVRHLRQGGIIAVISFHSLEDRIVKNTFKDLARTCICPKDFPVCVCSHRAELRLLSRAIVPSKEEVMRNKRSKSAKLRLAEKL